MASWERYRALEESGNPTAAQPITDKDLTMEDRTANVEWSSLIDEGERQGFLVQNASQNELRVRVSGETVTGTRLPGYGDSFSPDFQPHRAYEIQADADGSAFVLTVW